MNEMKAMSAKEKKKGALVPRLRFPEFRDSGEWVKMKLTKIANPVSDRATDTDADAVLTLSAEYGVVAQGSYFGKKVAGNDVKRYIKIKKNDFVYNDRTTKLYKYGTIKRLSLHSYGIVSPIYKCFRFNREETPVFWEWYFESGAHDAQLHSIINEGAKEGRFNISIQQFLSTLVCFPSKFEQQKIADFFSSLDGRIAAEANKLDTLKTHKKGLLKQLFPAEGEALPALRFPEFRDAGEWEKLKILQIAEMYRGKGISKADVSNDGKHSCIRYGELYTLYNEIINDVLSKTNAPLSSLFLSKVNDVIIPASGETKFDIATASCVMQENVALGGDLNVLRTLQNGIFISYYINGTLKKSIARIAQGDTVVHLYPAQISQLDIALPHKPEQQRIADCLSSLDELISAQTHKIELLKSHKKGLMQQLFPVIDEAQA